MEDAYGRRSDVPLDKDKWAHDVFFCGDDAYQYFLQGAPLDEIVQALGGAEWRPDVGVVTALPNGLETIEKGDVVEPEQLETMAGAALAVIVGGWDHESLCFWEPAHT